MGKFSDALAKGRESAKEERQKKKHQDHADTARRLAGVAAALTWTDRVVYRAVQKANADLEESDLVVNYDGGPTDIGAEVTLTSQKSTCLDSPSSGHRNNLDRLPSRFPPKDLFACVSMTTKRRSLAISPK